MDGGMWTYGRGRHVFCEGRSPWSVGPGVYESVVLTVCSSRRRGGRDELRSLIALSPLDEALDASCEPKHMQWEYARHDGPWAKRAINNLYSPRDEGYPEGDVKDDARKEERGCKDSVRAETGIEACTGQHESWDLCGCGQHGRWRGRSRGM